jgi:hypothetical protein
MTITTLFVWMGLLVLAVCALGLGLWQLVRERRSGSVAEAASPAPLHGYGPMARLFDRRDLEFLSSQPGYRRGMATRLRLERRKVLSLYLWQARADFRACWEAVRAAASFGQDTELAGAAVRQLVVFHGLYLMLRLQCFLGLLFYVRMDVGGLLSVLQPLQRQARGTDGQQKRGAAAAR